MPLIDYEHFTEEENAGIIQQKLPARYSILRTLDGEKIIQISNGSRNNPNSVKQTIQLDEDTIRFLYAQTLIK